MFIYQNFISLFTTLYCDLIFAFILPYTAHIYRYLRTHTRMPIFCLHCFDPHSRTLGECRQYAGSGQHIHVPARRTSRRTLRCTVVVGSRHCAERVVLIWSNWKPLAFFIPWSRTLAFNSTNRAYWPSSPGHSWLIDWLILDSAPCVRACAILFVHKQSKIEI